MYEEDARAWCVANNIGWCDIHECEYTDVPGSYSACAPCGWEVNRILDLCKDAGIEFEDARAQIEAGYADCECCGWCSAPGRCVWSVVCPLCGVPPSIQCREGGRNVKLHKERHEVAQALRAQ
jgi:hypothetical protein